MAFQFRNLDLIGKPVSIATDTLGAYIAAEVPVGTLLPAQNAAAKVLGIGQNTYSKSMRELAKRGIVTKVGFGIGFAAGKPTEERISELKAQQKARGRNLIERTRSRKSIEQGARSRQLRAEIKAKIVERLAKEDISKHVIQALQAGDLERLKCCELALRMVGAHHDQSEEAAALLSKQTATAAAAIASVAIAFKPAEGPADQIKTELQEIEVVNDAD